MKTEDQSVNQAITLNLQMLQACWNLSLTKNDNHL